MTASQRTALGVAVLALAIAGCSDDDDPGGGGIVDTTAPAVTSVTAVDIRHIDVAFDEEVQRSSAEDESNYVIVEQPPILQASAAPGDTLIVTLAEWAVDELDAGPLDGVYFVGAFLDANYNFQLDAGDPRGLYGGATPIPIRIENGGDAVGVVVTLEDPKAAAASAAVTWPRPLNRAPWLKAWSAAIRQHTMAQRK